jgi:hypothetical protein
MDSPYEDCTHVLLYGLPNGPGVAGVSFGFEGDERASAYARGYVCELPLKAEKARAAAVQFGWMRDGRFVAHASHAGVDDNHVWCKPDEGRIIEYIRTPGVPGLKWPMREVMRLEP